MDILAEINRVMELESRALGRLRQTVGPAYEKAVLMIYACPGKVILTGMGKSGIIAQKVASTMVSTGTPATFLHPAEGAHGDIGIAHKDDVILAISKSGESDELIGLLPTIRRIGARLITITTNADSAIARNSDIVLLTPVEEEACPLNMAPTCSTTSALVVLQVGAMFNGQASSSTGVSRTMSELRAIAESALAVIVISRAPMRRVVGSKPIRSSLSPDFLMARMTSYLWGSPLSPL